MKVLILSDRYAPEARAAAYLATRLAEALAARGHEVRVISKRPDGFVPGEAPLPGGSEVRNEVRVLRLGGIRGAGASIPMRAAEQLMLLGRLIPRLLFGPRPDVLIVYSPPLPWVVPAMIMRVARGTPYVINLHDLYPQSAVDLGVLRNRGIIRLARFLEKAAYRLAAQIVVAAPSSERLIAAIAGSDKVRFSPNYVDIRTCTPGPRHNEFRRRLGIGDRFLVLYAGLIGRAQDLTIFVDCARRMMHRKDVVFAVVGDGVRLSEVRKQAAGLTNVLFAPPVADAEYVACLRAADACLVSLDASFHAPAVPGKVGTIMAAGRPLIAAIPEGNDTRDLIAESGCGVAIAPGRSDLLERTIESMIGDPAMCEELGANGVRYAKRHLSLDAAIERFELVLASAAMAHSHRPDEAPVAHSWARSGSGEQ
jgi:colanic acid biosynthesis glycosyl transferase WcaI